MANTCCPQGYVYVTSTGQYSDPYYGGGTITNFATNISLPACLKLSPDPNQHGGYIGIVPKSTIDPISCPCCPNGYEYSSALGTCASPTNAQNTTSVIPCVICDCTIVAPQSCGSCGTQGLAINFSFNPFERQCTDCTAEQSSGQTPKGKINCFLPTNYINPPINFIIKIKNLL